MVMTRAEFLEYLTGTLIPDLRESGLDATADDFESCVQFMDFGNPEVTMAELLEFYANRDDEMSQIAATFVGYALDRMRPSRGLLGKAIRQVLPVEVVDGVSTVVRNLVAEIGGHPVDIESQQFADRLVVRVGGKVHARCGGLAGLDHWFVEVNGRFFDAESPDGVVQWLDLPFFRR